MWDLGDTGKTKDSWEICSVSSQKPRTVKSQVLVSPFNKCNHIRKKPKPDKLQQKSLYLVDNLEGTKRASDKEERKQITWTIKTASTWITWSELRCADDESVNKLAKAQLYTLGTNFNNLTFHPIITDFALVLSLFFPK